MAIISVENLTKSFKQYRKEPGLKGSLKSLFAREYFDIRAVDNISFRIEEGEAVGFIGPNGAGKTTTLKMLSGILYPTSGEVEVLGYLPSERKKEFLKHYALVMGQKSQLWWDLPPMEGFLLNKEIYEVEEKRFKESVGYLSEILGVEKVLKVPLRKLSLGQRMKCELIAALLHNPKILFLDEPTIGLDVVVQKKIRAFLKQYNIEKNTTLILTSHYMDDVQELCKRIIVINSGQIVYDGSLRQLIERYGKNKTLKLVFNGKVKKSDLGVFGEVVEFQKDGLAATLSVPRVTHAALAGKILNTLPVDDLDIAETSLEDIIRDIFENGR